MRDVEACLLHRGEHGFRRRRGGGEELDLVRQGLALVRGRVQQRRHHDRRAAQMRDLVRRDQVVHRPGAHRAQAHMGAGDHRQRPREAPAVAVEHRQRPQIDRMPAHRAGEHVADGEQIRAAVVIDHALGVAGGARGVVERDGVPLVVRHRPGEIRIALRDERLVVDPAEPLARAGIFRIVVVDHQRFDLGERQRLLDHPGIFAVGDDDLAFAVVELEGDHRGVEPRVDGVEDGARHRHAVVAFEHRRRVGQHRRHRVAAADAALLQRRGELPRARVELAVAPPQRAVHDRGMIGKHGGRALQQRQRRQRLEVRRVAVEAGFVG